MIYFLDAEVDLARSARTRSDFSVTTSDISVKCVRPIVDHASSSGCTLVCSCQASLILPMLQGLSATATISVSMSFWVINALKVPVSLPYDTIDFYSVGTCV